MYSADAIALFGGIKHAFDPDNLLNPGVLVDPDPLDEDVRPAAAQPSRSVAWRWPTRTTTETSPRLCTAARVWASAGRTTRRPAGVMCPSYLATREEKDSTRGRARVLQDVVRGELPWSHPSVHDGDGPVPVVQGVRIRLPDRHRHGHLQVRGAAPDLPAPAPPPLPLHAGQAADVGATGRPRADARQRRPDAPVRRSGGAVARRRGPSPLHARVPQRPFRRTFTARRSAPEARGAVRRLVLRRVLTRGRPRPRSGCCARAGYEPRLPSGSVCCGLTWITTGQLDSAKAILRRTVAALAPDARAGMPIVGLEPSCTAVLRSDVHELLPETRTPRSSRRRCARWPSSSPRRPAGGPPT